MPDITNLAANSTLNAKLNKFKNKIPSITNSHTNTALDAVQNKIPNTKKLTITEKLVKLKIKLVLL